MTKHKLPNWEVDDLPAPPAFTPSNLFRIIGPGAILLAASIGSGEWLLGPAAVMKSGASVLTIVTISVLLQVIFNMEAMRYTMYTGEPIFTGFMRTRPGALFWGNIYIVLALLNLGWPGWAATSASALFAAIEGRLPTASDTAPLRYYGYFTFLACGAILVIGKTIERMLERVAWFMLAYIFLFLLFVNIAFVPAVVWWSTLAGFFSLTVAASGISWPMLGALAAYAGAGGILNLTISNWARDKGIAMGSRVGAIAGLVGGRKIKLSPIGKVFSLTEDNIRRWREWWRYVYVDQVWIWGVMCLVGMFLTVNMARGLIPAGTDLSGLAAGAYQAEYLSAAMGRIWWTLTLLNGFWILFSTQLSLTDAFVRVVTDIWWNGNPLARRWAGDDVRKIYYTVLLLFMIWGVIALNLAQPLMLIIIGANMAGLVLALASLHLIVVNRTLLPLPLRAPRWREVLLLLSALFFGFFVVQSFRAALFH
jgi:hypothetical protein